MYVVSVTVFVRPEHAEPFVEAVLDNARHSRQEPGNVRFDVSRAVDDPCRFLLYEAYRSEGDFRAHQQTPHYLRWRERVADWMSQPRQGVRHHSLFPDDARW
ncbi:MAG TPA: putative quinol monooxygenase [Candidatus Polarisedimenticolaceae bacterium]|nr:putative quinol monooxygenase [Candidatus Polarisedimenticolaceae bacterium]